MNVGVVGLGLIGGSMAKAIKRSTDNKVFGTDINETVVCRAQLLEAIDARLDANSLKMCELVIIALYPQAAIDWLHENADNIAKDAVVIDVCGIKIPVCQQCQALAHEKGFCFIGAHPMAGTERTGFEASNGTMFAGASLILTPEAGTMIESLERVVSLAKAIGFAHIEITTPEHHDEMIAYTSQLAHIVSSAYVRSPLSLSHKGYSAGSYRDMTRVATLNEDMWTELFMTSRQPLMHELDELIARLQEYSEALHSEDADKMRALLRDGREQKARADGKVL